MMRHADRRTARLAAAIGCGLVLAAGACAARTAAEDRQPAVNATGAAIKAFTDRLDGYVAERKKVEGTLPPLKETHEPVDLKARQSLLRDALRKARAGLPAGSLITPEIAAFIRSQVRRDFAARTPSTQRAAREEVPPSPAPRAEVNTEYPLAGGALPTVPAKLLAALPRLPEVLEYRFLGRAVVLRDVDTNLVVDVVTDALPSR